MLAVAVGGGLEGGGLFGVEFSALAVGMRVAIVQSSGTRSPDVR